jgi:YhcH/YjgK/YiaL family protein
MIYDLIKNYKRYSLPESFTKALEHSLGLSDSTADGRYELGDGNFVNINSYDTKYIGEASPEAHQVYTDIQIVISGIEDVALYPEGSLGVDKAYDKDKDIEFYNQDEADEAAIFSLEPGYFAVFYPGEIHMPGLQYDDRIRVKKAIYKLK